jgi:ribosomal protein L35AE/L33A
VITLEEASHNIGFRVVYRPRVGIVEEGVITSVGRENVFVRYRGDLHSKATHPADLEWYQRPNSPSLP